MRPACVGHPPFFLRNLKRSDGKETYKKQNKDMYK